MEMKKIRIFLSSSNELSNERKNFENEKMKSQMWQNRGITLILQHWENSSTSMSVSGLKNKHAD